MRFVQKVSFMFVAFFAGLAFAQTAAAAWCNVDALIGAANPASSGQGNEETLLEAFAGVNVTFDYRITNVGVGFNVAACPGNANLFYINVAPDTPGYFVLKLGDGGTLAVYDTFFFQNVAELTELVFTSTQVECLIGGPGCPNNTNTGRLSHYSLYDGNAKVPEPGTLALLGIGALGFGFVRGRRKREE